MPNYKELFLLLVVIIPCCLSQDEDQDYHVPGRAFENCVCVPFDLCMDGEVIEDQSKGINPRNTANRIRLTLGRNSAASVCGPFHVCCNDARIEPEPEPVEEPEPEPVPEPDSSTVRPYQPRCGTRNPGGLSGRIVSGPSSGESEFGEWPWQAAILRREGESDFVFVCGGTLIDNRHILTVAHCVDKLLSRDVLENVVVRLGEWDTQSENEFLPHVDYDVEEISIHPQFSKSQLYNDIAVVRLVTDVVFRPNIDTACLPRDSDDFSGQYCVATGWGTDAYKGGNFSSIMKEVTVPVVSQDECQNLLRQTRMLSSRFRLHSGFMCAGGNSGEDSCKGDGGGPLVCLSSGSYTIAGLVSWGVDCGQARVPGVYVNVKEYRDWIVSVTNRPIEEYWNR